MRLLQSRVLRSRVDPIVSSRSSWKDASIQTAEVRATSDAAKLKEEREMKIWTGKKSGAAGRTASGFTLVETIVAVALGAIMLGALYSCFGLGFTVVRNTREDLQATQVLLTRVERARLCTWSQVTDPNVNPPSSPEYFDGKNKRTPCTVTFNAVVPPVGSLPEDYRNDVMLVTVGVTWTSGNHKHTRSMQTYVSRQGMNSFVSTGT
jgi:prepilin-type N-terminal cleavage/methylation domain-containing protein